MNLKGQLIQFKTLAIRTLEVAEGCSLTLHLAEGYPIPIQLELMAADNRHHPYIGAGCQCTITDFSF